MFTALLDVESWTENVSFLSTTLSSRIDVVEQFSPSVPVRVRVVDLRGIKSVSAIGGSK